MLRIGTAGWTVPRQYAAAFPAEGSQLERYATVFEAVEINSSFHRPHRPATYERWARAVPEDFRFAVKVPKAITHTQKLIDTDAAFATFLFQSRLLGAKLGPLLVQLPPKLAFDGAVAHRFFDGVRATFDGFVACEPRHATWFEDEADALLSRHRVARVAADPALSPRAAVPGGWRGLAYWRLHGSPRIYYSAYGPEFVSKLMQRLATTAVAGIETWCMFDNTASGEAAGDALALRRAMVAMALNNLSSV